MKTIQLLFPEPIHDELQRVARSLDVDTPQFCANLVLEWLLKKSHKISTFAQNEARRSTGNGTDRETLKQVFAVFRHHHLRHFPFNKTLETVATEFNVGTNTVRDKCTRRIALPNTPMGTDDFLSLLNNPDALRRHLCKRFPGDIDEINAQIGQIDPPVDDSTPRGNEPRPRTLSVHEVLVWLVDCLRNYFNGRGKKLMVEEKLLQLHSADFDHPHWRELVGAQPHKGYDGIPRSMKIIEFARNLGREMGLIKTPEESGRGFWELTDYGKTWSHK